MASSLSSDKPNLPAPAGGSSDPFVADSAAPSHHRYSNFDQELFAAGPGSSPRQAKRALEAHLLETERRLGEAGKLGTALVAQRKALTEQLQEVEKLQAEGELGPGLRKKLVEIEKDYNDLARDTARALLPKQRVPSNETNPDSPHVPAGGRSGRRSVSPSKFESQATGSPTKLSVPNRKIRNQPSNRVHDIEFVSEISTSLIAQVRNLQSLLAERDDEVKGLQVDKSRLELEAENIQQRLKTLDESEHRYKDENWNLETRLQEANVQHKEAADREKKMNQALNVHQTEKVAIQKELDEVKLLHAKLAEEHAAATKNHDIELGTAKRNMVAAEGEREVMQRKIEELTSQNQELAKAFSISRGRTMEREQLSGMSDEEFDTATDNITPEHSPPPSPVKGTPRHSVLETETMKTSLHHAQRTIQSQRSLLHREKTEKLELRRIIQDLRDELEKSRNDLGGSGNGRRSRKVDSKEFRKQSRFLGSHRSSKQEILEDDPEWEDNQDVDGAGRPDGPNRIESSDHFETANEASESAFETANERATETEGFQTGHEELSGSDGAATETEGTSKGFGSIRRPPVLTAGLGRAGNRDSFISTASTSDDEDLTEVKTPTATLSEKRSKGRLSRGPVARTSRQMSEEPFRSSPASFVSSAGSTPQAGQSLFAELQDFDGSDDESIGQATPSRRAARSVTPGSTRRAMSPTPAVPELPKVIMVDSGVMTEPVTIGVTTADRPESVISVINPSSRWLSAREAEGSASRPLSGVSYSDAGAQHDIDMDEKLAQFPVPPSSPPQPSPPTLSISGIQSEHVEPREELAPTPPLLSLTPLRTERVEPVAEPEVPPPQLKLSSILGQHVKPVAEPAVLPIPVPLAYSTISSEHVEPVSEPERLAPALGLSSIATQKVDPQAAPIDSPVLPNFGFSNISSVETEPVTPRSPHRDAFILPRDSEGRPEEAENAPETPTRLFGLLPAWGRKKDSPTVIAEDDTRQSPRDTVESDTPESQRPFKEISSNANVRPMRKQPPQMSDQGAQTSLTSEDIDAMALAGRPTKGHEKGVSVSTISTTGTGDSSGTVRIHREKEGFIFPGNKGKGVDENAVGVAIGSSRRPSSSASVRSSLQDAPPLPANHRQLIEAARTSSSSGAPGNMGPPLWPASALKQRPQTPSSRPMSPQSGRGTPTPRAHRSGSVYGSVDVHSPTRYPARSRQSSVSSFASEIDTRFNMRPGDMMDASGFGPNTDPRMIQAITQTMIGEYLWKYTRKTGRGDMSEKRHRRYFWVHPYTRTLYWSDRDPSSAGKQELKAKSVAIEAVRVVTDDNPMPPGLHRKSLIILSPGRTVKFTCTTGQRHETWFNALSYLLLRTNEQTDAEDVVEHITQEDVEEFNPQYGRQSAPRTRPRPPPSLSSYNSRTTRNESPAGDMSMNMPTLTPTTSRHQRTQSQQRAARASTGTFSKLSEYWKPGKLAESFSSRRNRSSNTAGFYEASEVHDSAEDLREMIERQDREADRLENVRACCDGKHNVGDLHHHSHSSRRNRNSHSHPKNGRTSTTPMSSMRSRG